MASCISYKDQFIWVSNNRFSVLIDFVIEIGRRTANTDEERGMVEKLNAAKVAFFPGYDLDLEKEFTTLTERKFWTRCFFDLGRAIFLRTIGKHDVDFWQSGTIGDSYTIARLLTQVVRAAEPQWSVPTADSMAAEEFYGQLTNIKL